MRSESDLCGRGEGSKVRLVMTAQRSVRAGSASLRHMHMQCSEPGAVEVKLRHMYALKHSHTHTKNTE